MAEEVTAMEVEVSSNVPETTVTQSGIPEYAPIEIPPAPRTVASMDSNGSRLMITNIVNENFKSYAGSQTLGPFHKSFSSIVGPNGSGKSNVIDSMLFVFGYRANKIRSKKISVLIHKSENHRNLQSCTVGVHFQKIIDKEDDDYEVVPGSQFIVSRTAFADSSSYYKINDKKSTFKEVATLLRASGIDLDHNRFLILQGEVEQIAMMKPKAQTEHEFGMLEFLEDIIGSSRFKEPIDMLSKRVEDLNEIRGEKLNRVKAVEKEKDDLEDVKNEALEYLKLENDIVKKKNVLYQKYIEDFTEQEKKAVQKRDDIKLSMKDVDEKLAEINEHKKEKSREAKTIYKSYETLSVASEQTKEAFAKFEQQDVRCREDLKHAKAKKKKLEKTLEQEKNKLEELKMIPEKSEKEVEELKNKLQNLNDEKEKEEVKLAEVMESLKTETQGLQGEKEDKEKELVDLEKIENEAKSKYQVTKSEHELYLKNQNAERSKLVDSQRHFENCLSTLKDRRNAVKDLTKKIPEVESAIQKNKKDFDDATNVELKITEQIKNTRMKVEEAKSSLNSARSQGTVLKSLMDLKRSGRLPGVYGRLGDLGAIDEKYDVAISTACGALDNIVTESMDCAQQCVEFLKKNNVGTATFIGMDKMDKWKPHCKKKIKTPENVPRLFDLVTPKEESIQPAFYYVLRDTLVAKDLDQATRIAYGATRYRVVTIAGQLIDLSGTMSGGGHRVNKGRMGSSIASEVDPKQVQEWEQKLASDTKEAQNCRDNKHKLEESIHKMERSLNEMKHTFDKFSMEIQSLGEQETRLQQQIEEQKQRVVDSAPDKKELAALEKSVETHKKEYEKTGKAASAKQAEVQELHRQIMVIGGTKMKSAQSRVNTVQSQIDQVTGHMTKANVAIKTAHRNAQKTSEKVKGVEAEMEENKETLNKLDEEFKQLEKEAVGVMQEHKKATEKMKEAEVAMDECKREIAKLEEKENKMNSEHIEIKHELEKYENVAKDQQSKVKYWKKELSRLELHQIEGEEQAELQEGTAEELAACKDIEYEITVLEEKLRQMKPNMAAIAEYRKKEGLYLKRVAELDQITELRDAQRKQHEDLRKQRLDEFMDGFTVITSKLKEMYQMITLGGDAELELVDSLDPFSEGIVFSVRPPKKSWKNISNLSGGEKTLSSLALVFALHHYKPTPLYVMDEIDAALDFKNVSIVANYIKERTKNAQFIIISLRNNMFELADRLIGIYKTYNSTKTVTLNPLKVKLPTESIQTA